MYIAVDFDGTCVTHEYPEIGESIGAVPVLKRLINAGHKIILNTMRSGVHLDAAVEWFGKNNIPLFGINENPTQREWTNSPKVYAHIYIDDAALGCPLSSVNELKPTRRPFVDWIEVEKHFYEMGVLRRAEKTDA